MRAAALLLVLVGVTHGLVSAYHVEPVTALWSGKARPDLGVSELVTCCWDQLDSVSGGGYAELLG